MAENTTVALQHVAGPRNPDQVIASAACILRAEDFDFIRPDDLVVIGSSQAVLEAGFARVAEACVNAGAAALAWPEWTDPKVVSALIEHIAAAGIGVYSISEAARMADIVGAIVIARALPETTRFQRLLHMQMRLVDSLQGDPPVESLLQQLALLTDGIVGITDDDGGVEAASGTLPFVLLRQEASALNDGEGIIEVAGWSAIGCELRSLPGEPSRWLFVARRQSGFVTAYVRAAANVAASLLDGTRRIGEITAQQDLVTRAFILRQALETELYENSELLATRAGALGIDFSAEIRVLEIQRARTLRPMKGTRRSLRDHVLSAFQQVTLLVHEHDDGATVLAQCNSIDLDPALDRLLRLEPGLLIGVGRPIRRIGETRVSWHDATLAAQAASRTRERRILRYDDFDFGTRLLADVDRTQMSYWVGELLTPLHEKPILMDALVAYFEDDLDIMKASKRLDIHHNTLRYRLTKIEEAIGGSLQSPARIASLHLALAAERSPVGRVQPLRPSESGARHGVDLGDTDILHGDAMAPMQHGIGEPPKLD